MDVLSLAYLGNIQYYSKICQGNYIIDVGEHYIKQSFRNRCQILTHNGIATLSVNVVNPGNFNKTPVKDIRIDYSKRWQHQHWNAFVSSYRATPYFEYYSYLFEQFYFKRYEFLYDLNYGLLAVVMRLLGFDTDIKISEHFIEISEGMKDWRNAISTKPRLIDPDPFFHAEPYWQPFDVEGKFVPNLSVIDLLFCEGTQALSIIQKSCR